MKSQSNSQICWICKKPLGKVGAAVWLANSIYAHLACIDVPPLSTLAEARQPLLDKILTCLPDKIKLDTAVYQNIGDGYTDERIGYKHGFNDAIDTMEQNTKLKFGGSDETTY